MTARRAPVLVYCQHLLGLGHAHRTAAVGRALVRAGERVVFVVGGPPVPGLGLDGAECVPLPPLVAADEAVTRLVRPDGQPADPAYLAERRDRLLALLADEDPAVVLLELFPFGRHALASELAPLLLALADARTRRGDAAARVAVSLRDVLVSKRNQAWNELAVVAVVERFVDRVLVHGSPDVLPLARTFGLADRLAAALVYTGYVAGEPSPPAAGRVPPPAGEVVVSGGGGRVAEPLFRTALAARALSPPAAARPWRLITGPYLPPPARVAVEAEAARLSRAGGPPIRVETFRPDFPSLLGRAALSVSQAGYNTVLDVVRSGVPAVVVPYEGSGDEQPLRARLLAERGVLLTVEASGLTPDRLAAAMTAALTTPGFPAAARLDLDGAGRTAAIVGELVDRVMAARTPVRPGARAT
jgi:predicted glycosyltransferase